jgi:hypothetical protein
MPLDYHAIKNWMFDEVEHTYTEKTPCCMRWE